MVPLFDPAQSATFSFLGELGEFVVKINDIIIYKKKERQKKRERRGKKGEGKETFLFIKKTGFFVLFY